MKPVSELDYYKDFDYIVDFGRTSEKRWEQWLDEHNRLIHTEWNNKTNEVTYQREIGGKYKAEILSKRGVEI